MAIIRLKFISGFMLAFIILIWAVIAIAAVSQTTSPSWFEHVDLMQASIVGLVAVVAWFSVRTLKKIDANQTLLFNKYGDHEHRLSRLEGEHSARTGMKLSCTVD